MFYANNLFHPSDAFLHLLIAVSSQTLSTSWYEHFELGN